MMEFIRELRLIPIALIASVCLLALKTADFMLDGGSFFAGREAPAEEVVAPSAHSDAGQQSGAVLSWARRMFNFPDGSADTAQPPSPRRSIDAGFADITGAVNSETAAPESKAADKGEGKAEGKPDTGSPPTTIPAKEAKQQPAGTPIQMQVPGQPSPAERAILERLQERRQELDTRARELDIRESLIKAAEKRVEGQLAEMKEVESRIAAETQQKDEAEAARFKGLVTMYENMKPRDAAKIFDRLDPGVLFKVASQINPRRMSDIMAQMSPDTAQRLTVEMASKAEQAPKNGPTDLPKIEGKPTTP